MLPLLLSRDGTIDQLARYSHLAVRGRTGYDLTSNPQATNKQLALKMLRTPSRRSMLVYSILSILLLISILSIARIVSNTVKQSGGIDGHAYWYSGHFLRQGSDPYGAFRSGEQPNVPVKYLDGRKSEALPIAQQGLSRTPANTMTMVLFLSPLSFFSWPTAKAIWIIVNLALMLIIPLLTIRLLPHTLKWRLVLLICLLFIAMQGTRVAAWTGQTTLLVFTLMLGALLTLNRVSLFPGLMLGLALSKFTLAFPVFLFVAYRRRYPVLAISLLVQLCGLALVSFIGHRSPIDVLSDYWSVLLLHTDLHGIHLAPLFNNQPVLSLAILVGGSALVFLILWRWLPKVSSERTEGSRLTFAEYHGLVSLFLWSLLAIYHRVYDTVLVIAFIVLLIFGLVYDRYWDLPEGSKKMVFAFLVIFVAIMLLPGSIMGIVLPDQLLETWLQLVSTVITLTLLTGLSVSLLLLRRLRVKDPAPLATPDSELV